jgi:hypothetical protein
MASAKANPVSQAHRAERRQLGRIDADAMELSVQEGAIERRVVSDDHSTCETVQHIAKHIGEARRLAQVAAADLVDVGGAEVTPWVKQRAPGVFPVAAAVDRDQRKLDDPVMGTRVVAGCLALDDDERALPQPHGVATYTELRCMASLSAAGASVRQPRARCARSRCARA